MTNTNSRDSIYLRKERITLKLLTPEEVAEILKIQRKTVYSYIKDGKIKAGKVGKEWRIREEDLKEYLREIFEK